MKEIRDSVDQKVSGVDSRVSALDTKTSEGINALKSDVQNVDQRASQANSAAERAANDVGALEFAYLAVVPDLRVFSISMLFFERVRPMALSRSTKPFVKFTSV